MTEHDIEAKLVFEERNLEATCGRQRTFRMMKLYWEAGDYIAARDCSWARLVDRALDINAHYPISGDVALAYAVNSHHWWMRKVLIGRPLQVEPGPCPLVSKPWGEPPEEVAQSMA